MLASLASRPLAAFPVSSAGRLPRYPFRGLLNVHCALSPARSLNRPRRPFSIEVLQSVSLPPRTAPIATGWSDSCRTGSAPAEKQRLSTAHDEIRFACRCATLVVLRQSLTVAPRNLNAYDCTHRRRGGALPQESGSGSLSITVIAPISLVPPVQSRHRKACLAQPLQLLEETEWTPVAQFLVSGWSGEKQHPKGEHVPQLYSRPLQAPLPGPPRVH